jgi:hypothetical protein
MAGYTGDMKKVREGGTEKFGTAAMPTTFSPLAPSTPTAQQQLNGQAEQNLLGGGNVINDMITGNAYNAAAIQQRQGLARYEQNQRAQNAQQIHQAGFAGTPIGSMYANATEADLARNRFDTNLGIEVARQDARMQGAQAAQDYANNVNRFDADRMANRNAATANFASTIMHNLDWLDAVNSGDPEKWAKLMNDPGFKKLMQDEWVANGGTMAFNEDWAKSQILGVHDPRLNTDIGAIIHSVDQLVQNGYMDADTGETWKFLAQNSTGIDMSKYVARNDDGSITIDREGLFNAIGGSNDSTNYQSGTSNPWTGEAAKAILSDENKLNTDEYNKIIGDMANDISTGQYTPLNLLNLDNNARDAVIAELNDRGLVETRGSGKNAKDGNGYHYFPNWNNAYKNKQIVMIEGRPAYITNVEKGNTNWNEYRTYSITYLDGVEPKTGSKVANNGNYEKTISAEGSKS